MSEVSLSKKELRAAMAELFSRLVEGDDDDFIADAFGMEEEEYLALKAKMMDAKGQEFRVMPPEHVFVDYVINQYKNVGALTKLINKLDGYSDPAKVAAAQVSAIKARAGIYDQLVDKGQSMGVFKKEPNKIVGGILIADLGRPELQAKITETLAGLDKMISKFGEGRMLDIRVDADSLHVGEPLPPLLEATASTPEVVAPPFKPKSKKGKSNRSKTSANARGARVR